MKKVIALFIAMFLMFGSPLVFASVGTQEDGVNQGAAVSLNFGAGLNVSGGSVKTIVSDTIPEVYNTTDQTAVLAIESGRTYIATQNTKFQLPAVADGLTFTFAAGAAIEIEIQVATTPDTIVFCDADGYNNGVIETSGTNTTGNSVTLVSDGTSWYAIDSVGEWESGGDWTVLIP